MFQLGSKPVCPSKSIIDQIKSTFGLYHYKAVSPVHQQICTSHFTQGTAAQLLYLNSSQQYDLLFYLPLVWYSSQISFSICWSSVHLARRCHFLSLFFGICHWRFMQLVMASQLSICHWLSLVITTTAVPFAAAQPLAFRFPIYSALTKVTCSITCACLSSVIIHPLIFHWFWPPSAGAVLCMSYFLWLQAQFSLQSQPAEVHSQTSSPASFCSPLPLMNLHLTIIFYLLQSLD